MLASLEVTCDLVLFTDDTKDLMVINDVNDGINLKEDLIKMDGWTNEFCMAFNQNKFFCLKFGFNHDVKGFICIYHQI